MILVIETDVFLYLLNRLSYFCSEIGNVNFLKIDLIKKQLILI